MNVSVIEGGDVIWMRDSETLEGIACTSYVKDGTQQKIITALEDALNQAKGEQLCWDNGDGVTD
ncbi:TPA: Rrf2 family transcriptional regulator [Citrobacter freundii]|nr:Rrf2 family transcriptional regulator [Citrobacter freundii]HEE9925135.1 Rrf2 family transcriptional regulator [Citrobacter freundii]